MNTTGFVFDERYLLHKTFNGHPECAERLLSIIGGLSTAGLLEKLMLIKAEPADQRWIEAVHNIRYIMKFEEACLWGLPDFDHADNSICRDTYEVAQLAVGGVLKAIDAVMQGEVTNAFCAVRPPGHHAEVNQALGFCYFNNVAIGARYLQRQYGVDKVCIIDFDVHHGNGTQHIFDTDNTVFYYSIHEHPSFAYPGTGREFETGYSGGEGFTLNSTILPGRGDEEYREKLLGDLVPAFESFAPEAVLLSAGFDAHESDLMSGTSLTTEGYDFINDTIMELVNTHTNGKVVSVLEGGYQLDILPVLVTNHIRKLMGV
ncbi:MAG: histone deacetylase [Desulfofustis sp.]|jgi:acetoin utilization deacetylase AcuC-like enzyme|nr:histone deacetylase [Desulfofustis sp.]